MAASILRVALDTEKVVICRACESVHKIQPSRMKGSSSLLRCAFTVRLPWLPQQLLVCMSVMFDSTREAGPTARHAVLPLSPVQSPW